MLRGRSLFTGTPPINVESTNAAVEPSAKMIFPAAPGQEDRRNQP